MQTTKPSTTPLRALSASLIKTWETCSWLYYCKYVLKLPDTSNDGARRGTLCHKVFEVLQTKRHLPIYEAAVKANSITGSPALERWVIKMANKANIADDDNMDLVRTMLMVGLKHDFFIDDAKKVEKPEYRFEISDKNNRFKVKGFIDLLAFMKDGTALIRDYKSSKAKFGKAELNPNLQNLIYSWVVYRLYGVLSKTQFLFLKFSKQPVQEANQLTVAELKGVEEYFAYVQNQIKGFDEKRAKKSYATRSFATKWLCGSDTPGKWCCAFRKPFEYYALLDAEGNIKKSSFENDLKPRDGETVEKREYKGCPRYY